MSVSTDAQPKAQPETVALFVSDIHLSPQMPKTAAAFFGFLAGPARRTRQLYLLGDIFEYWAGDDDLDDPFNRSVVDALRAVSDHGVALYWIAGNRDFLVGDAFAQACGATLLPDPFVAEFAGAAGVADAAGSSKTRLLLLHGDAQCTDDTGYMAFRAQVRDRNWQLAFLARPLAERKTIIASLREGSRDTQRGKTMAIMDVNGAEIAKLFTQHRVNQMIHGHTHRPAVHRTAEGVRYVLPDWDCEGDTRRGGWLAMTADGNITAMTLDDA